MSPLNLDQIDFAVVVAPHPDDETIGAFHLISKLRRSGAEVDVIVMTDGAASHRNSKSWPAPRLVATRKAETEQAMAYAGISRQAIDFLDLPDGGLRELTWRQRRRTVSALRCRPLPQLVVRPSLRDDHPDHRVVARLCKRAWGPAIPSLSYLVWPDKRQSRFDANICVDGDVQSKRKAMDCYQSQLGIITDDPDGFSLTPEMLERMCRSKECFAC